jgi:DNA primase
MDVLALYKANIGRVVAPLGTAISEEQIISCWKICPEPIIMLDGDNAGIRAAERLVERIVPYLRSGCSLKFCMLPKDEDPDSLVASGKTSLMANLIKEPKSILEMLWSTHVSKLAKHTLESAASLKRSLRSTIGKIVDADLRQTYGKAMAALLKDYTDTVIRNTIRPAKIQRLNIGNKLKQQDKSDLAAKILVATILNHPHLLGRIEQQFLELIANRSDLNSLGDTVLSLCQLGSCSREQLLAGLAERGHDLSWLGEDLYKHAGFARDTADDDVAYDGWISVWENSFIKRNVNEEARLLANKLKINFSESDWTRLQALKSSVLKDKMGE